MRVEIGAEVRDARLAAGLSQTSVAVPAGASQAQISRIERGASPRVSIGTLSQVLAVLGLRLSLKAYPEGSPIRDAAQGALLRKLRNQTHASIKWRFEVPVTSDPEDLRSWDAVLSAGATQIQVEAETRLSDLQTLQRREELKQRDATPGRVILLISGSHRNRRILAEHGDALRTLFLLGTAAVLAALREGRDPRANGIVVL